MKIFILNPLLFTDELHKIARKRQPLSLAYIASLLRKEHKIKLLDANALELNLEQTLNEIKKFEPDILILTSTPVDRWEVPSHEHIKLLIDNIVQTVNQIDIPYIILTGAHGTVMPEYILEKTKVDFVVRGEPEIVTLNLIKSLANHNDISKVKGISYSTRSFVPTQSQKTYRNSGQAEKNQIINNPKAERIKNLDDLPIPAYDLLPMEKYSYTFPDIPKPFSIMITSRGCPFNCSYCLKVMMPEIYITRSPQNVVEEIKYLVNKFSVQGIYFQDWEFLINQKRVIEICDLILQNPEYSGLEFKWGCNARAPDINNEIVNKMKKAGCVRINIGFETGSQKILDLAQKNVKLEDFKKAINILKKYNINCGIYSILNLPGETKKTIAETEKFLADNKIQTMCAPNLPIAYIGTLLYNMLCEQENKKIIWKNLEKYAGKINVAQPPWLARVYRWHYKYKYTLGNYYFLKSEFYKKFIKLIKSRLK